MTPEEAIKAAPTAVLCEAAGTLQKAHDYVETHNFSMEYGHQQGAPYCCYIGSVRQAAHEHHTSASGPSVNRASELALSALDLAAQASGYTGGAWRPTPGGIAEASIVLKNDGMATKSAIGKPEALETYRSALRLMQTELMSRDDAPVPA